MDPFVVGDVENRNVLFQDFLNKSLNLINVQFSAGQGSPGQGWVVQGSARNYREGHCSAVQGRAVQGSSGQGRAGQGRAPKLMKLLNDTPTPTFTGWS